MRVRGNSKRVGQCRCGWFPCVCSFSFTVERLATKRVARVTEVVSLSVFLNLSVERFGHQESPPVALCVSPCVFLLCHRWEAGHQEGEPGRFHVDTCRAHDAWRFQEGVLPRFREGVCFNRVQ